MHALVDHLLSKTIASTLDEAWEASQPSITEAAPEKDRQIRRKTRRLLGSIRHDSALVHRRIEAAFPDETTRPESAKRVLEIGRKLEKSLLS